MILICVVHDLIHKFLEVIPEKVKAYKMEFAKFAEFYSTLGDGSYQVVIFAQVGHCLLFTKYSLVSRADQLPSNAGRKFTQLAKTIYVQAGFKFAMSGDPEAHSFPNISQATVPDYRITLDSCTFDKSGMFETSLECFGRKEKSEILAIRDVVAMSSSNYTKAYVSWLSVEHVPMRVLIECDFYDLHSMQFQKPQHQRTWVLERTMFRKMARELDQLVGAPKVHYRGVRWRPERKYPWVAEIKLPRRKKIWIGNFDTREEAARAHDLAAIYYQHCEPRRNFQHVADSSHTSSKSTSQSIVNFKQQVIPLNPSQFSTFYYATYEGCDYFGESRHQVKDMAVHASSSQDKSIRHRLDIDNFVDSGTSKVVEVPEYSQVFFSDQGPRDTSTCSQNARLEDKDAIDSLYMFAKDLPSMT